MSRTRTPLGDTHNFGRRVTVAASGTRIAKPRTLFFEWLVLSAKSPLRCALDAAAEARGLGHEWFSFLPDLAFAGHDARDGGEVERIDIAPFEGQSIDLARIVGRSLALFSWLGLADLHWENLVLGNDAHGRIVFAPLDVEMILADLELPTETKLLPDAEPEYAALNRHACGVRRALPYLGKPIRADDLVSMTAAYRSTLALLDRAAPSLAEVFASLPSLKETPIRVCLRATGDYVRASSERIWPPLLDEEIAQMDRGDIPYFFRLYGQKGIHYYGDPSLATVNTLPLTGDVPQLEPLLSVAGGLRSQSRASLREQGLFTVIGAFDHASLTGTHRVDDLEIGFRARTITVKLPDGDELETRRDMSAFVASVYLPCVCGEVRSALAPPVTVCDAHDLLAGRKKDRMRRPKRRGSSRQRAR